MNLCFSHSWKKVELLINKFNYLPQVRKPDVRHFSVRPLFFISLFLVTSARRFRRELKKKKKNRPLELSSEVRTEPNMIVHANNNIVSKRGLPLVCFKYGSASPLPVAEEVSSKFQSAHPVCQECLRRGCVFALEGRSRCAPDCHTRWLTWPGPWLRCVWSQLKKNKSLYVLLCACDQMLCETLWIRGYLGFFFGGGGLFFFRLGA